MLVPLLFFCQLAQAQQPPPKPAKYSIKGDHPSRGLFKNDVATGSLPFKKRYSELTPEEQATLKAAYENMDAADEPPFPINGLHSIYKTLADAQGVLGVKGNLVLYVDVNSEGRATSVAVMQSPDERMTRFAAGVVMREKYKPAVCGGQPCNMQFPVVAEFKE